MLLAVVATATLAAACCPASAAGGHWSYEGENSPENWGGVCNIGKSQSPVDLVGQTATPISYPPMSFIGYSDDSTGTALNNGHTVQLQLSSQCTRAVTSGGLPGVYILEQLHFHWDAEHTLSGKRWLLELHFVHYHEHYSSVEEALKSKDGVAVIAVLFHLSDERNHAMEVIEDAVRKVSVSPSATQKLRAPIKLQELLPKNTGSFFRYHGSLTTPKCNESVLWTVFENTISVTKQQLESFRRVRNIDLNPLEFNYRPIQLLNDRDVKLNHPGQSPSASCNVLQHVTLPTLAIILATLHRIYMENGYL